MTQRSNKSKTYRIFQSPGEPRIQYQKITLIFNKSAYIFNINLSKLYTRDYCAASAMDVKAWTLPRGWNVEWLPGCFGMLVSASPEIVPQPPPPGLEKTISVKIQIFRERK